MATNIRWTVTKTPEVSMISGDIIATVSLAVEGEPIFATIQVIVTIGMTAEQMLGVLREQMTPAVNNWLQSGAIKAALTGATGIEVF